ncbi:tripartite tricarboxylate transporter TctB family protein [Stappia indica]|uniref:Tripartite tricarboxylate transporter TctB family protein n=1 Tax=Stappia indica TaxID=538381 RepID=A0A857C741_9HYPH|nr:tripartite tricarboxylate transporter TctB family protein [Stappia indica]QGZ34689.1 tripartite tricarboxylate transporter TctB family protein [Stappia indica]
MQPKLNRDAVSGFLLALVGAAAAYRALDYGIGSAARMGSGYFPLLIGGALVLLGAVIGIGGLRASATQVHIPWRELLLVALSVASFALTIGRFGLFPALGVSVLLACLADRDVGLRRTIGIVLFSCLLVWLVFVIGLNSPAALIKV